MRLLVTRFGTAWRLRQLGAPLEPARYCLGVPSSAVLRKRRDAVVAFLNKLYELLALCPLMLGRARCPRGGHELAAELTLPKLAVGLSS